MSDLKGKCVPGTRSKTCSATHTPNSQSMACKVEEVHIRQEPGDIKKALYKCSPRDIFQLLFGILVLGGAIAALGFKIDSPMYMQILYVVAAGCGIHTTAGVVKQHLAKKEETEPGLNQPSVE